MPKSNVSNPSEQEKTRGKNRRRVSPQSNDTLPQKATMPLSGHIAHLVLNSH
jgi:hypothetical protein